MTTARSAFSMSTLQQQLRVLLVEDSRLLAERLLELLATIPGTSTLGVVATEKDAIIAVRDMLPDVLILDLHLKQGTGFGVLRAMHSLDKYPAVVVLTNYALPQYRTQAQTLGAQYFLDKSCEFDRLPEVMQEIAAHA